ncbi:MAG: hypothetical protein H6R26_424, partial [Proteobacteria bacterium]|nr:hypothetical protein [Pseudomonadota bacterium]
MKTKKFFQALAAGFVLLTSVG